MNSRILQVIWKLQRASCRINKLQPSALVCRSYATGFNCAAAQLSDRAIHEHHWNLVHPHQFPVRNLATDVASKPKRPIKIEVVLQSIDNYYTNNGSVNYDSVCMVLDALEQDSSVYNQLLDVEQAIFLLRAFGNLMPAQTASERMLLFKRLWNYLDTHKQLTSEHYLTALEVRTMNCAALSDYQAFIEEVKSKDVQCVNAEFYAQLIRLACECGELSQAKEILAEMREKQYGLTEHIFHSLIIAHARKRDLDGVKTVLESMSAANLPPSIETQTMLVCAYLENEQLDQAQNLLEQFKGQFSSAQIMLMLKAATLLHTDVAQDVVKQLMSELPLEFVMGTEVSKPLRNLCIELIRDRKLNTAVALIELMPTPQFNENQDIDTFAVFLLHEMFRVQIPPAKIIKICDMLIESNKNTRALHVAAEICLRRNPPSVLPFFQAISEKETLRTHYFWPLMMYNFRRWGESGIFRTLRSMSDFNVDCDNETITHYVLPRLAVTLENPQLTLKSFTEAGIKTSQINTPIIRHMLTQQNLEQAYKIAQLYPSKMNSLQLVQPLSNAAVNVRATKRYHPYVRLIHAIAKKSDNPKEDFVGQLLLEVITRDNSFSRDIMAIERLLIEMQKFALQVSIAAAELIGTQLNKNFQDADLSSLHKLLREMSNNQLTLTHDAAYTSSKDTTSSFITHPRDMKRDELECHLIELEAKGLNTRGVLRRLLQLCVRDGKLERALEIKHKCDELKIPMSPGMLASIFDLYVKLKDLPNAEACFKQLQKSFPGFLIDEHKILDFATLLVQQQQLDAAKRILSERAAAANKIIGGDYVMKNIWNLLTSVAHLAAKLELNQEQNLARETFEFLQQLGYCIPHNTILGPIVREYLLRNDLRSAVKEYGRIVDLHARTPLQFELLSTLVKLANNDDNVADSGATNELFERFAIKAEEAQSLLTSLTEFTTQVYGVENMNSSLLLAFAESGTPQQLRRLMMDPNFRINQNLLLKNCEFLSDSNSMQTLLNLARSARGLNHIINEQNIYNMLLSKLKDSNNYEGALELFERLEADDELKVSQDFLNNLVNLLRFNNIEIPSNLALRAKIM